MHKPVGWSGGVVALAAVWAFSPGLAAGGEEKPVQPRVTVATGVAALKGARAPRLVGSPGALPSRSGPAAASEPTARPSGVLCLAPTGAGPSPRGALGRRAKPAPSVGAFAARGLWVATLPSHYAGFVTNYPHDDGVSYNVYNSVNEKMPLWGVASGGPAPGVADAVWVGGDFDLKYSTAVCGTSSDCYIPPPVDGLYRGWRTQGQSSGPCNCPTDLQRAYYSANRGLCMFDLSALPDHAVITQVAFGGKVAKQFGSGERLNLSQIESDRSAGHENAPGTGFKVPYDDCSDGNLYTTAWNVAPYAVGNPASVDLGPTAVSDLSAALGRNWFGVGLVSSAGETASTSYYFGAFEGSGAGTPPTLTVGFQYTLPDAPPPSSAAPPAIGPCTPVLEWDIPDEADGNPLHFEILLSDTGPAYRTETFADFSGVDFPQTSYAGMVDTATRDVYDAEGALVRTEPPGVRLDPLDVVYGGAAYPYGDGYNVGWRFSRPFVSHIASDTWTGGGYSEDGLGDALAGRTYMEWASDSAIDYPNTACATDLGYPANVTSVGGYLPSGLTESFEVAVAYAGSPSDYIAVATVSDAQDAFQVEFDPPLAEVVSVGLFFTDSTDGYAYLADLQVTDAKVYETGVPQTFTSAVVADTGDPALPIAHATLAVVESRPAGTSIAYEMSNDDGATWNEALPGVPVDFPGAGYQLRWRANLSTADRARTPQIRSATVSNLLGSGTPIASATQPAGFTQNATVPGSYGAFPAGGVPEHAGTWYQARYPLPAMAAGDYYWRLRAVAPAGSGDAGAPSAVWRVDLGAVDTTPPPDTGDVLRASRSPAGGASLTWDGYTADPEAHFHLRRSPEPDMAGAVVTEVAGTSSTDESTADDLFFQLRAADACENESAD